MHRRQRCEGWGRGRGEVKGPPQRCTFHFRGTSYSKQTVDFEFFRGGVKRGHLLP